MELCRFGSPKETLNAPRHKLRRNSARMGRIVLTASVSAPTVMASGSMTISSIGMPYSSPATLTIFAVISSRCGAVSGMPVSSSVGR